jgi:outer membrane protein assembly factor BamA
MNNLAEILLYKQIRQLLLRNILLQISVLILGFGSSAYSQNNYKLNIKLVDKEASFIQQESIQTEFPGRFVCQEYLGKLQGILQSKGFVTASIDSVHYDSASAYLVLFAGQLYKWALLDVSHIDNNLLITIGWREKNFSGKPIDFTQLRSWEGKMMDQMENTGYPFAKIFLDSIAIDEDRISAILKLEKGPLYHIDSIRIYGNAKISNEYLQRYLDLPRGAIYSKEKLVRVNKKIRELTYIEEEKPFDLSLLATGSVLNMYLKQKRSSQVNVLVGFLPNNDQLSAKKLLLTGEANILLKNALGSGETIGLNWQQIQVKSPRLNLFFNYPYLFHSPVGLDLKFDILRKDSSYVNIDLQLGAQYSLNANQGGKIFIQQFQTILNASGINAAQVIASKRLPDVGDVSSFNVGLDYEFNSTDYRLNPRKGNEFRILTTIGTKKLKKNSEITDLKDPADPTFDFSRLYDTVKLKTYQLRTRLLLAKYFPLSNKRTTVKTALNAGLFQSGTIFRNEVFQVGGYKLLRGFDEESQYFTHFAIGTVEFRYLVGTNSFFYALLDGGWGRNNIPSVKKNYTYVGTGVGLAFETKAGIFNLAWAIGKRNDTEFNLRQSKIHFGFVNYF